LRDTIPHHGFEEILQGEHVLVEERILFTPFKQIRAPSVRGEEAVSLAQNKRAKKFGTGPCVRPVPLGGGEKIDFG